VGRPAWYPLNQEGITVFDEQEQPFIPPVIPFFPPPPAPTVLPFPAAAGSVHVGGSSLPVPYSFGWLYLDMNTTIAGNPNPPEDPAASQAWVSVTHSASGRYSVGYSATQLGSAGNAATSFFMHFFPH
jgi:hypothetical protein